jgi:hypothetical protein
MGKLDGGDSLRFVNKMIKRLVLFIRKLKKKKKVSSSCCKFVLDFVEMGLSW